MEQTTKICIKNVINYNQNDIHSMHLKIKDVKCYKMFPEFEDESFEKTIIAASCITFLIPLNKIFNIQYWRCPQIWK